MNQAKRKEIRGLIAKLNETIAIIESLKGFTDYLYTDEQHKLENMSEKFEDTIRYQSMENSVDALENAVISAGDALTSLECFKDDLEDAL